MRPLARRLPLSPDPIMMTLNASRSMFVIHDRVENGLQHGISDTPTSTPQSANQTNGKSEIANRNVEAGYDYGQSCDSRELTNSEWLQCHERSFDVWSSRSQACHTNNHYRRPENKLKPEVGGPHHRLLPCPWNQRVPLGIYMTPISIES